MKHDDLPMNSSPSEVDPKDGITNDDDTACLWQGKAITFGELVGEFNAMLRDEIPLVIPENMDLDEDDQRLLDAFDPSELWMEYTWKSQYMEDEEYFRFLCKLGGLFAGGAGYSQKRERSISRAGKIAFGRGRSNNEINIRKRIFIYMKVQKKL
ncbi:MAG: hypothetical protein WAN35_00605 [Terracidiphilus sp.]